ncbi:unnamed protein product [Allacma fusca]|uniref:Uncharacterized protein n=1 Tax=Allacma fusca TaxID=39272 RepID=A0A8J2LU14_9HEXA|nr:unnamed protein product [Allacma fusca]
MSDVFLSAKCLPVLVWIWSYHSEFWINWSVLQQPDLWIVFVSVNGAKRKEKTLSSGCDSNTSQTADDCSSGKITHFSNKRESISKEMASELNGVSEGKENMDISGNVPSSEDLIDHKTFPPTWASCVACKSFPKSPDAIFLPCLHICCSEDCLSKLFEQPGAPYCPECYLVADRNTVHPCAYLNDNIEVSPKEDKDKKDKSSHENQICKSCVRDSVAQKWCVECQEFLCEFCCEHHQYGKATRGHTLAPTSEGIIELSDGSEASVPDRKCQLHSEEDLISFCVDCQAALCSVCTSQHANHILESLDDLAKSVRSKFYAGIDNINFIKQRCEAAVRELDIKLSFVLRDQKQYLHTEARAFFKRLIDTLLQREIQLRKDLVETTLAKAKELNIKKAKTTSIASQCEQYLAISKDILEKGTVWNVLHHKQYIENQYKELQHMQDTLSDPEKFDHFVEKNWAFYVDPKPVEMAEKCIQLMCQARYRDRNKEGEFSKLQSKVDTSPIKAHDEALMDIDVQPTPIHESPKLEDKDERTSEGSEDTDDASVTPTVKTPGRPGRPRKKRGGLNAVEREKRRLMTDTNEKPLEETKRRRAGSDEKKEPIVDSRSRRSTRPKPPEEDDSKKGGRILTRTRASTSEERSSTRSSSLVKERKSKTEPQTTTPVAKRGGRTRKSSPASEPEAASTESSPEAEKSAGRTTRGRGGSRGRGRGRPVVVGVRKPTEEAGKPPGSKLAPMGL